MLNIMKMFFILTMLAIIVVALSRRSSMKDIDAFVNESSQNSISSVSSYKENENII